MDIFNVKDKIVLITGASRGIGKALALGFHEAGAVVYAAGSKEESVQWMAGQGINPLWGDFSQPETPARLIQSVYAKEKTLDVLINNAGIALYSKAVSISDADINNIMEINFKSVFHASVNYYKEQKKRGVTGTIINISSILGIIGSNQASIYSATKGAIIQLTKNFALEWAKSGFRVNSICPGYIETDMTSHLKRRPAFLEAVENAIPQKRLGKPEEILGPALFLASPASSYITGQCIIVDGGLSIP